LTGSTAIEISIRTITESGLAPGSLGSREG
jgi:hypothetical protein